MDTTPNPAYSHEYPTFGLPAGSVRGLLSVLICSFFWLVLLWPTALPLTVPLGHFFLLTLVFMAFATHPVRDARTSTFLPWLMRVLFVGGSAVVVALALWKDASLTAARLTPGQNEIAQWPVLLACLAGGFGFSLLLRSALGRHHNLFLTLRAWMGVVAMLLLFAETILQFLILPGVERTAATMDGLRVWEGILIAVVAAYFGSRT